MLLLVHIIFFNASIFMHVCGTRLVAPTLQISVLKILAGLSNSKVSNLES